MYMYIIYKKHKMMLKGFNFFANLSKVERKKQEKKTKKQKKLKKYWYFDWIPYRHTLAWPFQIFDLFKFLAKTKVYILIYTYTFVNFDVLLLYFNNYG